MKQILLTLFAVASLITAKSQCDPPLIANWEALDDTTFSITFMSSDAGTYELFPSLFDGEIDLTFYYPLGIIGDVEEGLNTIEFVMPVGIVNSTNQDLYFLNCQLIIDCDGGGGAWSDPFYLSNLSLSGNENFFVEYRIDPFEIFAGEFEIEFSIDVPATNEIIENIAFFIDAEMETFYDQFKIELIHPNGTTIQITANDFLTTDLSVLYADNLNAFPSYSENGHVGVYAPLEPLNTFQGMPSEGEWKIKLTSDNPEVYGFLFSAGININGSSGGAVLAGSVFHDINENGVFDADESSVPYQTILNSLSNNEFTTFSSGNFWVTDNAGDGDLTVIDPPTYFAANSVSYSVSEGEFLGELDLPIVAEELVTDIAVDLFSLTPNRPGFSAIYSAQVSNVGSICENDITVSIFFPEYVEIIGSTSADFIITNNTGTIDISEVCPFEPFEFNLTILLDDTVSLGTMLEATISANVSDEDPNELNNTFTSVVEVVGSYDPNDKQVSATTIGDEFLEDGAPLKYTIRFQNTGTFYAERVVIVDTIDADLDLNSLQIISTSHNMQLVREGNVVFFGFDQIFLPDSATDFDGSIGHVRYEITPFPTFSEGQTIDNTAYIYFDFNEPIVTNTVVTEFGNPLSISNEIEFETRLFPNPANQNITISWAQDVEVDRIEIYDLSGRLLKSQNISAENIYLLEVSDLSDGMYLINLVAGTLQSRQKFMKLAER